jgi:hypothetical protein
MQRTDHNHTHGAVDLLLLTTKRGIWAVKRMRIDTIYR